MTEAEKAPRTIDDLSDEPRYTIKTVCGQTGIRAVTLRAWERRHELLNPQRADNRYRLYSDRDVAILRWIKNRVDNGVAISNAVSELHSIQRNGMWPEAIPDAPAVRGEASDTPPHEFARQLYLALIKHDEARAGDLLQQMLALFDLTTICAGIITPALVEIGEAWYNGQIRITTEHFASAYLRGKLLSIMQSYPMRRGAPYVLVGCAPGEQHEIGSLMFALLLRSYGLRIEYLGPDIPIEDLVDYASYEHPQLIVMSASAESTALELSGLQGKLNKQRPAPTLGFGGGAFNLKPELRQRIPGVFLGETLEEAVETARQLAARPRSGRG